MGEAVDARVATAAWSLLTETAAGVAWRRLADDGIPAVLLKGPSIGQWLYPGEVRHSRDIDLLVSPAQFDAAQHSLAALGYTVPLAGAPAWEIGPNSQLLFSSTGACIDLHHHLIGFAVGPERSWEVLSQRTAPMRLVSGAEVAVLDLPARTMHLALHVAQHGPAEAKAMADLERGLAAVGLDMWRDAAALAGELGAGPYFAAGLRLAGGRGGEVADALGLPASWSVELALRTASAPQESLFFGRLGAVPGVRGKVALVGRKLWPTPALLRVTSPVARRGGRLGLLGAHLWRPVSLAWRSGPALAAWRTARGEVRRASSRPTTPS